VYVLALAAAIRLLAGAARAAAAVALALILVLGAFSAGYLLVPVVVAAFTLCLRWANRPAGVR
jgi:hypothetical protein